MNVVSVAIFLQSTFCVSLFEVDFSLMSRNGYDYILVKNFDKSLIKIYNDKYIDKSFKYVYHFNFLLRSNAIRSRKV